MERQQQPPPETFDFKIKFAETKAHAKVGRVGGPEGVLGSLAWMLLWNDMVWGSCLQIPRVGSIVAVWRIPGLDRSWKQEASWIKAW